MTLTFMAANQVSSEPGSAGFPPVQMLRLLRLVRSARILRFVGPLRILLLQIVSALKSVVWAFVLLVGIIYLFALLLGVCIVAYDGSVAVSSHWNSLSNIMISLFLAVTGGFDWEAPAQALKSVHEAMFWILVVYIAIITFAVLNVV